MPIQPEDFYDVAKFLISGSINEEAYYRTAISRIYYYVFLHLREIFDASLQVVDKRLHNNYRQFYGKGKMHSIIRKILKEINPVRGNYFARLQRERRISDYDIDLTVTKKQATDAILLVPRILNKINMDLNKINNPKIKRKIGKILKP